MEEIIINGQKYLTPKRISANWGVSAKTIRGYCIKGLVPGFFVDNRLYYIPFTAIKPNPHEIKAALALCSVQSNCDIGEETLNGTIYNGIFLEKEEYLLAINFIRTHSYLGKGRFELTSQGVMYLNEWKEKTIMQFLNRHFTSIQGSVISPSGWIFNAKIEISESAPC